MECGGMREEQRTKSKSKDEEEVEKVEKMSLEQKKIQQ